MERELRLKKLSHIFNIYLLLGYIGIEGGVLFEKVSICSNSCFRRCSGYF
jgi:hypothetical protein